MKKMVGELLERAKKLREGGWTYQKIADDIGMSYSAVHRALNLKAKTKQEAYESARTAEKRIYDADHYITNKVKRTVQQQEYFETHKSEYRARGTLYRALKIGAIAGNLAEIKEIYRRAKEDPKVRCYLCGKLIPIGYREVDHIVPLSKGGAHRPSNLAIACIGCNRSKHDKMPEDIGLLL